ncbi:hypothetical protein JTE90_024837 [Oedothorax gibbosus]|uniref:Rho-GAP domain-containing protein n=1 Tax=Oedothorax gibbosus TaxID=931172 RepID=A0AAV6U565_9ARAC|nr:hypothetical protein JTE90_024837 [Oedothorax gibbosus]
MLTPNQHQEASGESRIDKMRKFLSSPLTRKKPSSGQCKTFGTPLDSLLQRSPSEHSVPFIITRLCQYILKTGLTHEGLFRISGNARSVERLRVSFDRSGDAPLETEGDVPSAAALLKLFLRELPDPIIPLTMHREFLNAVKDKEKAESIACLTELVEKLPPVNYSILNYLFDFLLQVSKMEDQNRMSASSLGIVFGPNLFRVTEDFIGLKEQSLTNQIVTYFISEHDTIFQKEADSFSCHSYYTSELSKTSQVSSMVSSWPEAKGNTTSMLSTWSLGPLSAQNETSDDDFMSLSSLSHSLVQSQTNSYISLKCSPRAFTSDNNLKQLPINPDYSSHVPDDLPNENSISSPFQDCLERRSSVGKEYYIMEEEPILCHSSLSETVSSISPHSSPFHKNDHSEFGSPSLSKTPNSTKAEFHIMHSLSSQDCSSDGQHPVCVDVKRNFEISQEKTEMLKDSHKIYPRGRRRFVRPHKTKTEVVARRSQSELRTSTHLENEDEFNGNSSGTLSMYDKTNVQHNSTGNLDESSTDSRHSWPAFKKCREEEDIALSPLPQQLGVTVSEEASISPSAFRSYLSHRSLHLDPSLPPSPPVEQEDIVTGGTLEAPTANSKQLVKKVHSLKKKIKLFEENFEKLYGFKPSHSDKSSNIAVKKMLLELNKARQDLKDLKDNSAMWDMDSPMPSKSSRGTNTRSSLGLFSKNGSGNMSIEDTVKNGLSYLTRHRSDNNRPEDLEQMNKEQLVAEKIAVQKVLLNFESLHGRPASKAHRELVRPLYDRYRSVKRLIARNAQGKDNPDLVPILEGQTMDFKKSEETTNLNIEKTEPKADQTKIVEGEEQITAISSHINFHEYSLEELESEINIVKDEKRRLRKTLKEFEDQFKKEHGRKVQREDKRAMESCYTEYKNAKAKLKLLEALVAKYEQTS